MVASAGAVDSDIARQKWRAAATRSIAPLEWRKMHGAQNAQARSETLSKQGAVSDPPLGDAETRSQRLDFTAGSTKPNTAEKMRAILVQPARRVLAIHASRMWGNVRMLLSIVCGRATY
jgi:hypothetical protein